MKPLQDVLVAKMGVKEELLRSLSRFVRDQIVGKNVGLFLDKDPKEFHIYVDLSSRGFGYLQFAGPLNQGMLVGLNLKGVENDQVNSYHGEVRGIYLALQGIKWLTQGKRTTLRTNSKSAYVHLSKRIICPKKVVDVRVIRLLA